MLKELIIKFLRLSEVQGSSKSMSQFTGKILLRKCAQMEDFQSSKHLEFPLVHNV